MENNNNKKTKRNPEKRLISASDAANSDGVNHILISMSPDGEIKVNGSKGIVRAIVGDQNLFSVIENKVKEHAADNGNNVSLKAGFYIFVTYISF